MADFCFYLKLNKSKATPAEASDQGALTRDEKNETLEDTSNFKIYLYF